MKPDRRQPRKPPPPLDTPTLERLALRYVERFATTRGKLADYLVRKIRERGWAGEPADTAALANRMAELGYVDDLAFAQNKAVALGRRGLGARRVSGALMQARVQEPEREAVAPDVAERAIDTALAFARRKRLGPWARGEIDRVADRAADRAARDKQLSAMLRAGHPLDLSRRILALPRGVEPDADDLR